ncbi:galactose-1-phosphate uridylyltransferase [Parerythrobacter aestuarii]|uniref:galactose-1-phosphate uridylyltransferase n=1 Tax=Parerythrobacter aestuarii TaxID=3020909 RepID=UPI0024DE9411|nr:galactose-1-phosphate uridylyltransferase [Parerythrobacter aestuarii]
MTDSQSIIGPDASGRPVHRRDFTKADGRMLRLYGHALHALAPQPQEADDVALGGELRFHPLRQEWNTYAAHRQNRTFKPSASDDPLAPTLPGGPATEIPFEDFEIAVFDNRWSAYHPSAPQPPVLEGMETAPALGACDVVVYGPQDTGNLHSIGQARRELLLAAWEDRYAALFESGCSYVLPFENRGDEVGVTLPHPHGQIYGFHTVPQVQQRAIDAFADGYDLAAEIGRAMPDYGLAEEGGIAAFCPRYARFPYEVWLAPRIRREGLHDMTDAEKSGFAQLLGEITRRYDALFQQPAATMLALHAAPRGGSAGYHFTAQFYPLLRAPGRVKYLASVEQHSGTMTVDVMPEAAAAALREV